MSPPTETSSHTRFSSSIYGRKVQFECTQQLRLRTMVAAVLLCHAGARAQSTDQNSSSSIASGVNAAAPGGVTQAGQHFSCMKRHVAGAGGPAFDLTFPVPVSNAADMGAHGFAVASCTAHALDLASFKRQMCELAKGNAAVQNRLETTLGASAIKFCALAKALVPDSTQSTN